MAKCLAGMETISSYKVESYKVKSKNYFFILAVIVLFLVVFFSSTRKHTVADIRGVTIAGQHVKVDLALTDAAQEKGLSGRSGLKESEGMLFVFNKPGRYGFWMKDMQFPIDMIWISSEGQVVHMEENIATSTYPKAFSNTSSAQYVLELDANAARKYGIYLGTKIDIASLKK